MTMGGSVLTHQETLTNNCYGFKCLVIEIKHCVNYIRRIYHYDQAGPRLSTPVISGGMSEDE